MRLIRQSKLVFYAGRTQKIYEIDLCEVGANRYVVNFRYGRQGVDVKDGSKTALPVALAEAERLFTELERSKLQAGYVPEGTAPPPSAAPPTPAPAAPRAQSPARAAAPTPTASATGRAPGGRRRSMSRDAAARGVLDRLSRGESAPSRVVARGRGRAARNVPAWSYDRALWRAGELGLREAEPFLLSALASQEPMRAYCAAWALGRCGGRGAVAPLEAAWRGARRPERVRRVAWEALRLVTQTHDAAAWAALEQEQRAALPAALRAALEGGDVARLREALTEHVAGDRPERYEALEVLYRIDHPVARRALLEELRVAPVRPPWFQRLRRMFKAAEYRRDGQVFGLLAWRFEKERAMFDQRGHGGVRVDGRWYNKAALTQELKGERSKLAYGSRTRDWLRRRVWRTLRRLGELGDRDFVPMAVGVLLPFVDEDGGQELTRTYYRYGRGSRRVAWPRFASYVAFNHLLYTHSPRYELIPGTRAWRRREGYRSNQPPTVREEAFAELWDQQPAGLLHLLDESRCEEVHQFAVRAVRSLAGLLRSLDVETALMLLASPYNVTTELGLEAAQALYDSARPQRALVLGVLESSGEAARQQGQRWVNAAQSHFLSDGAFLAQLLVSRWSDTRNLGRQLLRAAILPGEVTRALVEQLVSQVLALGAEDAAKALDISETLIGRFAAELVGLEEGLLQRLLAHPLEGAQSLGAQVLMARRVLPSPPVLMALLRSGFASVRAVAVRLVSQQTDLTLLGRPELALALLVNPREDVRAAGAPLLRRLVEASASFAASIAAELVDVIADPTAPAEVVEGCAGLVGGELSGFLGLVTEAQIWRLIRSKVGVAQELGGRLLPRIDGASMTMEQLVLLGGHEVLALRQASWALCERHLDKVKAEIFTATRLLDVRWQDTREFAFALLRDKLRAEDFTAAALVSVCDSVRPEVQRLGQALIAHHFQEQDGAEYLLRLSEHPSTNMQLFVTNYLERYAAGDAEKLAALEPYFVRALSQVNRGGLARQRIFHFLAREATGSFAAAQVVARVMERVSATIAVEARAHAVEIMVSLRAAWPTLETPLRARPVEARGGA